MNEADKFFEAAARRGGTVVNIRPEKPLTEGERRIAGLIVGAFFWGLVIGGAGVVIWVHWP